MRKLWRCFGIVILTALLTGCASTAVVKKAASVVAKPILGLAVKDARTTIAWIDREQKAGRLAPADVGQAKKCPEAVLALDALRRRVTEATTKEAGFKGLIYYGTLNRYGRGVQAEATVNLKELAEGCLPLIPAEKLITVF